MNVKQTTLCYLLLALMLHADYASAEIVCATISMKIPFCKGWMCKSECWLQKKLRKVALKEQKCTKGGIKGRCHCLVCKDVPRLN
ncbi:hypothetical protein GQ55_7G031400 [Panicum hallii var. hallii]|uniref:Knottin scorpion toxin-like domain-containing protein n=1 Tax=Panicum hallii var. hallii TaxID=1504633 RepID=A0A2T7CS97_9POAL|nr:hypothetical protein GQ55_7G031400 [Panicum hallii var. hallii]